MTGNTNVVLAEIFRRAETAGRDAIRIVAANIEDASLALSALIGISTASSVLGVSTTDVTSILANRVTPTVSAVSEISIAGTTTSAQNVSDFFNQWVSSAVSDFYNTTFDSNNYIALNAQALSALPASPQPSTPTASTPTDQLLDLAKAAVRKILEILKAAGKEAFAVAAGIIGANVAAAVLGISASPAAIAITGAFVGVVLRETLINGVEFTGQQLADFFDQWFRNAVQELWGLTFDPNNYVIVHAKALQTFQPANPAGEVPEGVGNPTGEGGSDGGVVTPPIVVPIGEGEGTGIGEGEGTDIGEGEGTGTGEGEGTDTGEGEGTGETIEIISERPGEQPVVDVQPADPDTTDITGTGGDDGGGDDGGGDDGGGDDGGGDDGGDPSGS